MMNKLRLKNISKVLSGIIAAGILVDITNDLFGIRGLGRPTQITIALVVIVVIIVPYLDPKTVTDILKRAYKTVTDFTKRQKENLVIVFNRACGYIKRNLKYMLSLILNFFLIGTIVVLVMRTPEPIYVHVIIPTPGLERHVLHVYEGMETIHRVETPFYWKNVDGNLVGMLSIQVLDREFLESGCIWGTSVLWSTETNTLIVYVNETGGNYVSIFFTLGNPPPFAHHASVQIDNVTITDITTYHGLFGFDHAGHPTMLPSRVYLPIRFISEVFGLNAIRYSDGYIIYR